jgi:penicillin-binding protein 1C
LKPFLYELALERRYLTAASLLDDSPINLDTAGGVYLPQDYDRDFKGLVSVRTALGGSLNIPAVRTLVLVGVEAFRDRLNELGYAGISAGGEFYGYSLALGSAEVSLWEQAQAYRALARGGRWSPIRLQPVPGAVERKLMPEDASFVIADILSDRAARTVTFGLDNHLNTPYWSAAKTGTSKDMRDNWCVGFSQRFTVAVWVGNFEGDSMHDVSGVTGAAPVWQEVMAALHQGIPFRSPPAPKGVAAAAIEFSPPVEPPRREWFIGRTGAQRIVALAAQNEITRISSPANGMVIAIDPDIPIHLQRVPFSAKGANPSMVLKLNGKAIGSAGRSQLWEPQAGAYQLSIEEADGSVLDKILFTVR